MNNLVIIGNLVADPELRTTSTTGKTVANFTVAVSRRTDRTKTDYFRVNAWNALADNCAKYLAKGKKVCVNGEVSVRAYMGKNGEPAASMEVFAKEIEFLTPREQTTLAPVRETRNEMYDRDQPF